MNNSKRLSLSEAKRLSLIKWEILRDNTDSPYWYAYSLFPSELHGIIASCGFCERHLMECEDCEFGQKAGICTNRGSLYRQYQYENSPIIKAKCAQEIINVINSIEDEQI